MLTGRRRAARTTVLFVCTGNICRSPVAERLARAVLDERGDGDLVVASAGTHAVVGAGVHPLSAQVLAGLGGSPSGFAARQLTAPLVAAADLVLTMTTGQWRWVVNLDPGAAARSFLLREAATLLGADTPGATSSPRAPADRPGSALAQALDAARQVRPVRSPSDVPDPVEGPLDLHVEVGDVIADSLLPVLEALAPARG